MKPDREDTQTGRVAAAPFTSIALRLPLIFIGAILFIVIATGVTGSTLTRTRLVNLVQENLQTLANLQARQIEGHLQQHALILESLSNQDTIQTHIRIANNAYGVMGDDEQITAVLRQRDEVWRQALARDGAQATATVILNVRLNEASRHVLVPERESLLTNLGIHTEFMLTDRHGALIGVSGLPHRYYQGDEPWWQAAMSSGRLYIEGPVLDASDLSRPVLRFVLPVRDRQSGEITGVLYSAYDYGRIKNIITQLQFSDTGRAALLEADGQLLYTVSSLDELNMARLPLDEMVNALYTLLGPRSNTAYVMTAVPIVSNEPAISNLGWYLGMVQTQASALAPVDAAVLPAVLFATAAGLLIVLLVYLFYIRPLTGDLNQLRATAESLQEGSLQARVTLRRQDELGLLGDTFNQMTDRLRAQIEGQDQIIAQRTAALRKQARQLEAVAHVGHAANSSLDLAALMSETVSLVRNSFGFYHVSIFLIDEKGEYAVVRESTGDVGRRMKEQPHKLAVGSESIVGWVTQQRQSRIALDVGDDAVHFNNPLLPHTRSEAALPLIAQGQLLGALDVQSTEPSAFSQEDLAILQLMTDQLAAAIFNARLYRQANQSRQETEMLFDLTGLLTTTLDSQEIYRRAARAISEQMNANSCALSSWQPDANSVTTEIEYIRSSDESEPDHYDTQHDVYDLARHPSTLQVLQELQPVVRSLDDPALEASERTILEADGYAYGLEVALVTGNEAIGILELFRSPEKSPFTAQEVRLVQAMAAQTATALNNANLTSEARGRVAQLSTLYRISQALSLAPDLKSVLDSAQEEIMSLTNATGMGVRLLTDDGAALHWIYLSEYGREIAVAAMAPASLETGLSGHVARTGEPLLLNNIDEETLTRYNSTVLAGGWSLSYVGIPLKVANELIGVLTVDNGDEANAFSERDVQMLTTIASSLAIAIQNQRLLDQMQNALVAQSEQSLRLRAVADISAIVSSILDLDELLATAVQLIQERFALYYIGIFLIEDNQAVLRVGTGEAGRILMQQNHRLPVGSRSLVGRATASGQPRIAQDVRLDDDWQPNPALPDTRAEMALPLRARGQSVGALTIQSSEPNEFTPELVSIFQSMCDQLATAIDGARLLAQTQARARRQQILNEVSAQLHQTADVDSVVAIALKAISEQLNGAPVALRLGQMIAAPDGNGRDESVAES